MNWKSFVEKKNAKTFVIPAGWDSREVVAEQLECSPDKVDDLLRPSIKSGDIIKQQFKVWDGGLKRLMYVTAYREAPKPGTVVAMAEKISVDAMKALKKSGKTWAEIGQAAGITAERARGILRRAGAA